jgi:hypothetical protein
MVWTLLPHLTACIAGESVLLLDLRQDRYFRLPARLGSAARQWLAGSSDLPPPEVLDLLGRQGVVRASDPDFRPSITPVAIPETLETPVTPDALGTAQGLRIAAAIASAWMDLRTRRLQSIVITRRQWRATRPQVDGSVTPGRLAGYHRARRLVPIAKNCLLDSLALDRWLGGPGPGRHLVFGVTVEPFLAHCWLQSPTVILNDNYDHVRRYTPILVL